MPKTNIDGTQAPAFTVQAMNDCREMQIGLEKALMDIEVTWAAAESARTEALKAAKGAFEVAKSLRDNWKREDGAAICDFAVRAREIAVQASSRASLNGEIKVCDEWVKQLIKQNATIIESQKNANAFGERLD